MLALYQVKNRILRETEWQRKQYLKTFDGSPIHAMFAPLEALQSSLSFGYLTLESNRWFNYSPADGDVAEFEGVSFSDVCSEVQSMIDLGGWAIRSKPTAEYMPKPVATLLGFIPAVGVVLHTDGFYGGFPSAFHEELLALIATMKRADWGIDLSAVE